jgi:hypothetical protein
VRRGTTLPLGQPPSHTPPGPASRHSPPLSAHIFQLYKDCVAKGIWAKLVFETRGGKEEYSFFCSPQPGAAATAAATTAAGSSPRQGRKKRPPNKRRRERARRRREAWIERRNHSSPYSNTAASATTAACTGTAAAVVITAAAATTVAEKPSSAYSTAAATSLAAALTAEAEPDTAAADRMSAAAPATTAAAEASSEDITAAAATGVKAVATTAAALRERNKVWAGERRSSARASVFEQRRNSLVSDSQESPEKLRGGDDLNGSFRIQFEEGEMQRDELTCSSCLSTHQDMNNPLCIFCGWRVLS